MQTYYCGELIQSLWIIPIVFCTTGSFLAFPHNSAEWLESCYLISIEYSSKYTIVILSCFWVATSVIVLMYIKIGLTAYSLNIKSRVDTANNISRSGHQFKVSKMLTSVVGTYFLLNTPIIIMTTINNKYLPTDVYHIPATIFWANCWVNPLIYCIHDKHFRRAYKSLITCCIKSNT